MRKQNSANYRAMVIDLANLYRGEQASTLAPGNALINLHESLLRHAGDVADQFSIQFNPYSLEGFNNLGLHVFKLWVGSFDEEDNQEILGDALDQEFVDKEAFEQVLYARLPKGLPFSNVLEDMGAPDDQDNPLVYVLFENAVIVKFRSGETIMTFAVFYNAKEIVAS